MRLTKTLLAAAVAIGATVTTAKAYDMIGSGWNYSQPNFSYGASFVGDEWYGREYRALTNPRVTSYIFGAISNANETDLVNAGVYRGISGSFTWSGNEYNDWPDYSPARVYGELESGAVNGVGDFVDSLGDFDQQNGYYTNGTYFFDSRDTTTNVAIGNNAYGIYMDTDGNYFGSYVSGGATVHEREVQVARTGSGFNGANAPSAFALDNSETLSASFYNADIVGRNVLPRATAGVTLHGSVLRQADIALGFGGSEGLYAKDGGWLDIRGDLTLGSAGTIYIRDGEITSNIYTQFYTPGTLDTVGRLAIESGILSVRERFAQDMAVTWNQTLGFRDGAVNGTRLILEGVGYGFDGEGGPTGPAGSSFGALRSITGDNVQNGNISVVADGEGFFPGGGNGAVIGTDLGSTLTINGTVNGLNSGASEGGAFLGYFSEGETIQNGRILSGIDDVLKAGQGELLLTASNLFTGDVQIQEGSLRITNSGALSGTSGHTFVSSGASLVLDNGAGLTLADDIHIDGTGTKDIGGAIHNKSGSNSTSGNLWIDSVGGGDASATVRVDGGTSLSVNNLRTNGSYDTLTVDVGGSGATAGNFVVNGETGAIDVIIKNGTGNASIAALEGAVDEIHVNGGNLLVLGSEDSAADNVYDNLDVFGTADGEGKPLGSLEFRGTHHYGDFNVTDVDMIIKGAVTQHYDYDGYDMDLNGVATVTVDAGASITTRGDSDGADIEDASSLVIKGTFNALDDSFIDLDDVGTLDIRAGGIVNSFVVADDDSKIVVASADGEGLAAGVLNGSVRVYDNATLTVDGVLNAAASEGRFFGIAAENNSLVAISGTANAASSFIDSSKLDVKVGGVLNGNVALLDTPTLTLAGTVNGNITAAERVNFEDPFTKANITVSGTVNGNITLRGDVQTDTQLDPNPLFGLPDEPEFILVNIIKRVGGQTVPVDGQSSILDIVSGGTVNGDILAYEDSVVTLRTGGSIVGNVDTFATARFVVEAGSTHIGDYTAQGTSDIVVNGVIGEGSEFAQNFRLQGSATLKGSGTITGSLEQTGGTVAPGNSPGILSIGGNYSVSAGTLAIEFGGLAGAGVYDPVGGIYGHDQLNVTGNVSVSGTAQLALQLFTPVLPEAPSAVPYALDRTQVYQVIRSSDANATRGTFSTADISAVPTRVLFDHSTGKAYGTGLTKGSAGTTFKDYGSTPNRAEIGRALWMESIDKDNSGLDDNYGTGALDPLEAAANSGQKVFILTSSGPGGVQQATGLGNGAVSVLTAADVGAALDALSPEAYVGVVDLGLRVARNFAQLPATKRKLAAANEWDFSLGYAGEQLTVDTGAIGASNHKISSDQVNLTAAKDLSKNLRLTLAAGVDDGKVGSSNLSVDTDAQAFGLGLGFTPDSNGWTADLGLALTRTDWTSTRGTSVGQSDNQDGLGVALRVSLAPTKSGELSYAPYIGLSYADQEQDAVSEAGTTAAPAVGFRGFDGESLVSELGLKAEYALKPGTTLTGVLAWEHDFEADDTTLDAEFTEDGVTDTRFAVTSKGFGQDIFRVGVGVRVELGAKSAFSLGYDALLSSDAKSGQGIKADVSFRF